MRIENKDFWEIDDIIKTQRLKKSSDFELFMFENSKKRKENIEAIKVFGCGTGREVESIAEVFNPKRIVASDISENMIAKCNLNLKEWKIDHITETFVGDATNYTSVTSEFDLVTILNSMMTYVPIRKNRIQIFKNSHKALKDNGVIIGTVHNQIGTLAKTMYFKLRGVFSFVLGEKVGNRNTGFNGYVVPGYYYSKKGLEKDLLESGFKNIEIYSLDEYYKMKGIEYNRKKGYNNLIFIASKG